MSLKHKRVKLFSLAALALLVAMLAIPLLAAHQPKVYATSPDQLCIPKHNDSTKEPDGWFTARFRNRAVVEVTYTPNGTCKSPQGNDAQYIFAAQKFAELINGEYSDKNTGDGTFEYIKANGSGAQSEESFIDQFDSSLDEAVGDPFGGQDKVLTRADILNKIARAEYIMGIEEDAVGADCTGDSNLNWALYDEINDGKPVEWHCVNTIARNSTKGFLVGAHFQDVEKFNITYRIVGTGDTATIQHVSAGEQGSRTFTWCPNSNRFVSDNCEGDLYFETDPASVNAIGGGVRTLRMKKTGSNSSFDVTVAGASNTDGNATGGQGTTQGTGVGETQPSCESEGGSLSWILCPLLYIADKVVSELDETINSVLNVPNEYLDNAELKETWSRLRNIAYIILLPAFLVMVISTALGFEIVSAYTVKKALPRLIAATMFIALSWEVTRFFVIFTNNIGSGMSGLITSSFGQGADITLASIMTPNNSDSVVAAGVFSGLVVASIAVTSIGIIISYALVTVVALLIGFIALSLRQMLIVALMLLAPLAILAWIFPGNDKLWKLWKESFSKLLLLYPLIAILIASGKVFASIVQDIEGSLIGTFIKLVAYIGPYFFIPTAFKLAGGLFATVAGMANDRGRGLFDKQKKYRTEARQELKQRAQENRRFNPHKYSPESVRGRLIKGLNSASSIATSNPWDTARIYAGSAGGKSIMSQIDAAKYQQTIGLQEALGKHGISNDRALSALAGRNSKIGTIRTAKDLQRAIDVLKSGDAQDKIGATQLQNGYSFLSDLHSNPEYGRGSLEGAALMSWSSQGFASADDIANVSNDIGGGLGASVANQATFLGYKAGGRPDLKPSYGVQIGKDGRFFDALTTEGRTGEELENAVSSQAKLVTGLKMQDLMAAKSGSIKKMSAGMKRLIEDGDRADSIAEQEIRNGGDAQLARAAAEESKGRAKAIRQTIIQSASAFSQTDPESRRQWQALAGEIGISAEQLEQYDSQLRARSARSPGAGDSGAKE